MRGVRHWMAYLVGNLSCRLVIEHRLRLHGQLTSQRRNEAGEGRKTDRRDDENLLGHRPVLPIDSISTGDHADQTYVQSAGPLFLTRGSRGSSLGRGMSVTPFSSLRGVPGMLLFPLTLPSSSFTTTDEASFLTTSSAIVGYMLLFPLRTLSHSYHSSIDTSLLRMTKLKKPEPV